MAGVPTSASRSRASIGGHPIHPMLIPFPVALLGAATATDLAYLGTRDRSWARASRWLIRAGLVGGIAAAPFGLTDFLSIGQARQRAEGWIHLLGNVSVLGLAAINLTERQGRPERAIYPTGLALSAATAGLLLVTSWFGGELTYRYGVGFSTGREGRGGGGEPEPLAEARRRAIRWGRRQRTEGAGTPVMAPDASGPSPDLVALREMPENAEQ